jgi:rRNA maturation endonuclease Nob1
MCTVGGPSSMDFESKDEDIEREMKGKEGPKKFRCNDCSTVFSSKFPECPACGSPDVVPL